MTKGSIRAISLLWFALLPPWLFFLACGGGTANERRAQEELVAAAEKDERPINFTFRMLDQDGNGARNFRFKVGLDRLHRFLWIWPYTREECHQVATDENGYVRMVMPGKKASYVAFKETDIDEYIFSKALVQLSLVPMRVFTDVAKPVELKVIRHGAPPQLREYHPHSLVVPAMKRNTFALSVSDGTVKSEFAEGELQIEVENSMAVCEGLAGGKPAHLGGDRATNNPLIRVCIRARPGYVIAKSDDEFVSYAPTEGYGREICTGTAEDPSWSPCKFFVKKEDGSAYYWIGLEIGCNGNHGIFFDLDGRTNLDGSNNLYKDRWPYKDEFKRYSERCP
jgi:hypothetical protein